MKKQEFKVGDQVRLKKNLKVGKKYGIYQGLTLFESMIFDGDKEILSIDKIGIIEINNEKYNYFYAPEMLTKRK